MKTIMLACAAGMSTSLLVTKMQQAAEAQGLEAEIFAVPAMEADSVFEKQTVDVVLLGPQVRFMLPDFEAKLAGTGIPVEVIPMMDYGMMDGEKVLALAEGVMK